MGRDTCRLPSCNNEPGEEAREDYRTSQFCSVGHELKYEHLKDDAKDAQRAAEERGY